MWSRNFFVSESGVTQKRQNKEKQSAGIAIFEISKNNIFRDFNETAFFFFFDKTFEIGSSSLLLFIDSKILNHDFVSLSLDDDGDALSEARSGPTTRSSGFVAPTARGNPSCLSLTLEHTHTLSLYTYLSLCLFVSRIFVFLHLSLSVFLSLYVSLPFALSSSHSIYLSSSLPLSVLLYLSLGITLSLSRYLFIPFSLSLSLCLPISSPLCLSIHFSLSFVFLCLAPYLYVSVCLPISLHSISFFLLSLSLGIVLVMFTVIVPLESERSCVCDCGE